MTAVQQQWQWEEDRPRSRLSEAELGETLFSTKAGRRLLIMMMMGAALFVAAWVKAPHALAIGFSPIAALVALYLYRYHPTLYLGFSWWVWCLVCFARRLIELKSGFIVASPILLAPYLVSLPMGFTLIMHAPKLLKRALVPFLLILIALCYSYIVGIVSTGFPAASYGLLVWLTPILLGFHIAAQSDIYPAVRTVMKRAIVGSVLFMGAYGVFQFVHPLAWDIFWMYAGKMYVIGIPAPMMFRVFSTMNSPAPFAVVMMASLIVVLSQRSTYAWVALGAGATALLLTTVRTSWLAFAIGFLIYGWFVPWRSISRIVVPLVGLGAMIIGVTAFTPLGDTIMTRFHTFGTLNDDVSLHERANFYHDITNRVMNTPLGVGMGGTGAASLMSQGTAVLSFDSGVLDILFSLGWFGALVFVIGLLGLVKYALSVREVRGDYFDLALRAGALATLSILPSFNSLGGVDGIVFWGFLGLSIARQFWVEDLREEQEHQARLMALSAAAGMAEMAGVA
jgi:hypothetical protein